MKFITTIKGKLILLLWGMVLFMAMAIKFYFIPTTDSFLELSVENDMKRNMEAFGRVIHTVAMAADNDEDVVRRALLSIHDNPDIPVSWRRSKTISIQHGEVAEKEPQNSLEERVFQTGSPIFRKKETTFEYIYPLKAVAVCQDCHFDEAQKNPVPLGYVLGLAISSVPRQTLHESKLFFFVKDLFVVNMFLFAAILTAIYVGYQMLVARRIQDVQERLEELNAEDDEYCEFEVGETNYDEIETIELHIEELAKRTPPKAQV